MSDWMNEIDENRRCYLFDRADLSEPVTYVSPNGTLVASTDITPSHLENITHGIHSPTPSPFADRLEYCIDRLDLD